MPEAEETLLAPPMLVARRWEEADDTSWCPPLDRRLPEDPLAVAAAAPAPLEPEEEEEVVVE